MIKKNIYKSEYFIIIIILISSALAVVVPPPFRDGQRSFPNQTGMALSMVC